MAMMDELTRLLAKYGQVDIQSLMARLEALQARPPYRRAHGPAPSRVSLLRPLREGGFSGLGGSRSSAWLERRQEVAHRAGQGERGMIRDVVTFLLFGGWRCWEHGHDWVKPLGYHATVNRGWPYGWWKADGWCSRCTRYHFLRQP
jgi:hypothetical protein